LDIRLFKILLFVIAEILLYVIYYLELILKENIPFFDLFHYAHLLVMFSVPVLLLLPEDNWIWLVEETPRSKKISLRSKSLKHLHLSMLYIMLFSYPTFIICLALFIRYFPHPYVFEMTWIFIGFAFVYGIFCSWKNYRNIQKYESLFAIAWDRRSLFFEIFIGFKVARDPFFFYSGLSLLAGILLILGTILAPPLYAKYVGPIGQTIDVEKRIVMTVLFHFFLITGVWITTMYVFFQIFFSRKLERWAKQSKRD